MLVVDNNAMGLEIVAQILMGFRVSQTTKCGGAAEAKIILVKEQFDLVILDDELPGQDGFELVEWVRNDPSGLNYTVPIVLESGNPTERRLARARDCGANYMVAKPLSPGVLLGRIEWLARSNRDFVTSDTYRGPDRRFHTHALPEGVEERRAETLRLMQAPERELSQDEISSLFG